MTDEQLAEQLLKKAPGAISELLAAYEPLMRYIVAPILSVPEEVEECISDAALRIWERIDQFDPTRGNFRTWLTAIVRNSAVDRTRKVARLPQTVPLDDVAPTVPATETLILQQEQQQALYNALRTLKPFEQRIFYRKYYYLQSTSQIAAELGLSERAVEGKLYRVKKKLRKLLGGVYDA